MFYYKLLCLNSISLPYWLELIRSSLTTQSNYFSSVYLSELILILYYLLLLIIQTTMFVPSPPLGRWWKTLTTILPVILLVRPRPHAKYFSTLYNNITGGFNFFQPVWCTWKQHVGPKLVSYYLPSACRLTQSVYDRIFSASMWHVIFLAFSYLFQQLLCCICYISSISQIICAVQRMKTIIDKPCSVFFIGL